MRLHKSIGLRCGRIVEWCCNHAFASVESVRRLLGKQPVGTISTDDLYKALNNNEQSIVLVDVRSDKERKVSRIPGAITWRDYLRDEKVYRNIPAVMYCTIGGRSYMYAARLASSRITVMNFRDGIVGWCRADLPLETPDKVPTNKVHTYWRIFSVPSPYEFHRG